MKSALAATVGSLFLLAACATQGLENAEADRTIVITMRDNHFEPDEIEVGEGEVIALRFVNRGSQRHDAFVGNEAAQEAHEREASSGGHAGHGADETNAVTVEPGTSETLVYTFAGHDLLIGCHEPGHYESGMVARVRVR